MTCWMTIGTELTLVIFFLGSILTLTCWLSILFPCRQGLFLSLACWHSWLLAYHSLRSSQPCLCLTVCTVKGWKLARNVIAHWLLLQGVALGSEQPSVTSTDWGWPDQDQLCWGLRGAGGWEAEYEPVMCTCSPKSQPYAGCIKSRVASRLWEGILAPLLHSDDIPPGALCPVLGFSSQKKLCVGASTEKGNQDD